MDQTFINVTMFVVAGIGAVGMASLGWFARTLWDRQEQHTKDIADIRVKLAGEYVSTAELAATVADIKNVVSDIVADIRNDLTYIRHRIDGMPQRRAGDPG